MITRNESGMNFLFEKAYYYSIEEDDFYKKLTSQYGVKVCDFITFRDNALLFIEAKSSVPKNANDLHTYTQDIYQKFIDSLLVYIATLHDRKNTTSATLTSEMKKGAFLKKEIKLILIVNGIPKKYLPELQMVFGKLFRKINYLFSISAFVLMNDEQARSKGLIE